MRKPDWDFWIELGNVKAWQAISLSINIDPDSVNYRNNNIELSDDTKLEILFNRRARLLEPRVIDDFKIMGMTAFAGSLQSIIRLAEFATWAKKRNWEMPDELITRATDTLTWTEMASTGFDAGSDKVTDANLLASEVCPNSKQSECLHNDHETIDSLIPGKMPKTANCKLAVQAAWELEQKLGRRPTATEVMNKLKDWAGTGIKPDVLISVGEDFRSVNWLKGKGGEKNYDTNALGKTLETWWKSRN